MASAARSLRLVCRSCRNQRPVRRVGPRVFVAWKSVSGGAGSFKDADMPEESETKASPFDHWEEEGLEVERKYRHLTPGQLAQTVLREEEGDNLPQLRSLEAALSSIADSEHVKKGQFEINSATKPMRQILKPMRDAFWDDEEPDPDLITNDDNDEFEENDMSDIAHAKLEEHREQREYARIAIWEMPLLASECRSTCGQDESRAMGRLCD